MATMASFLVMVGADVSPFVSGMTKMEAVASKHAKALRKGFSGMAGILAGALSAGAFVAFVKGALDAQEAVVKMSQKTGMAVSELSALRYAAALADVEFGAVGKGMKTLATRMVEGSDATSKSGKLFNAMTVDLNKGMGPALEQIADVFQSLPDGPTKAALAVELFGKAGLDMIPMLNQGSAGLRAMKEEAERLGIVMTEKGAKAAEEFNDTLKRFKFAAERFVIEGTNQMSEGIVRWAKAVTDALVSGGKLQALWVGLGGIAAEVMGLNDSDRTKNLDRIAELQQQMLVWSEEDNKIKESGIKLDKFRMEQRERAIALAKDELKVAILIEQAYAGEFADQASRAGGRKRNRTSVGGLDPKLGDTLKNILGGDSGVKAAAKWAEKLDALMDKLLGKSRGFTSDFGDSVKMLNEAFAKGLDKGGISAAAYEEAMTALVKLQPIYIEGVKAADEAQKEAWKTWDETVEKMIQQRLVLMDVVKDIKEEADAYDLEAKLLGKSNAERARYIAMLKAQKAGLDITEPVLASMLDRIKESVEAMEQVRSTTAIWEQVADAAAGFANALMGGVKKGLDYVRNLAKQFLADLVAIFMKRWVLNIAASLVGGIGGDALAQTAVQTGANTLSGAIVSGITSWLGTTALGGAFAGTGSAFMAGLGGAQLMSGAGVTSMQLGANSLGATVAALWWIAPIVIGMMANDRFFRQGWRADNQDTTARATGLGPYVVDRLFRSLGFSDRIASLLSGSSLHTRLFGHRERQNDAFGVRGMLGPEGMTGINWQDWSRAGGLFRSDIRGTDETALTPGQRAFFDDFTSGLSEIVGSFGRLLGVDAAAAVAGFSMPFNLQLNENGTPLTDVEISTLFSNLFGTALQEQVARVFDADGNGPLAAAIRALAGTGEEITNIIVSLGSVLAGFTEFDPDLILADAQRTSGELLRTQGAALVTLASKTDLTTDSLRALAEATVAYRQAAAQLLVDLENARRSIGAMFADMIQNTRLAGMDPQQQFEFWQSEANSLFAQIMASTDPGEIERLSGQLATAWNNAWSLMSPEEQLSESGRWGARLQTVWDTINTHITDIMGTVADDVNTVLRDAGTAFNTAATTIASAAPVYDKAADTFSAAVDRGLRVSIILDTYGNPIITESSA